MLEFECESEADVTCDTTSKYLVVFIMKTRNNYILITILS